jgi:hypothetical protein
MSDSNADMVRKFQAFLEREEKASSPAAAQVAFWESMRRALQVNKDSTGLEALDALAAAIIDDKPRSTHALSKPVVLLPASAKQKPSSSLPNHPMFGGSEAAKKRSPSSATKGKALAAAKKRASVSPVKSEAPAAV